MPQKQERLSQEYLSIGDVAAMLGISERTAHQLIHAKIDGIPFHKIGNKLIRVRRSDLHAWMEKRRSGQSEADQIVSELLG